MQAEERPRRERLGAKVLMSFMMATIHKASST